jgi:hypothetical protein
LRLCPAEPAPPPATFASLPRALAVCVFAFLPVDERMRCAEVCPLWREHVSEARLWTHLDFARLGDPSHLRGDTDDILDDRVDRTACERKADGILRAAAARAAAAGGLRTLDVSRLHPSHGALVEVMTAQAATLREVRVGGTRPWRMCAGCVEYADEAEVDELLAAAPRLEVLSVAVECRTNESALCLLRAAAEPASPLQLRMLHVDVPVFSTPETDTVVLLARAVGSHPHLQQLVLDAGSVRDARALDALADALGEPQSQLRQLNLWSGCGVMRLPDVGALAALLQRRTSLTGLSIRGESDDWPPLDPRATALLGAALRANRTLTSVELSSVKLWRCGGVGAKKLVAALAGHPSLRRLDLSYNDVARVVGSDDGDNSDEDSLNSDDDEDVAFCPAAQARAGLVLGALVATNARALTSLNVSGTPLGHKGLAPLMLGLRSNTHLRELDCCVVRMSSRFAKKSFLPAVAGNMSLRKLHASTDWEEPKPDRIDPFGEDDAPSAVYKAERLVWKRAPRLSAADTIYDSWPA